MGVADGGESFGDECVIGGGRRGQCGKADTVGIAAPMGEIDHDNHAGGGGTGAEWVSLRHTAPWVEAHHQKGQREGGQEHFGEASKLPEW